MRKIPTLFLRDASHRVIPEYSPECVWVARGEGVATIKLDGTACLVIPGRGLYRRHTVRKEPLPDGFIDESPIGKTGERYGWVPVSPTDPADRWHREAWLRLRITVSDSLPLASQIRHFATFWTFELVGPRVNGNPYGMTEHELIAHGGSVVDDVPRDFEGLRKWLAMHHVEGLVWWKDLGDVFCDKAKIKRRDFGLEWPVSRRGRC